MEIMYTDGWVEWSLWCLHSRIIEDSIWCCFALSFVTVDAIECVRVFLARFGFLNPATTQMANNTWIIIRLCANVYYRSILYIGLSRGYWTVFLFIPCTRDFRIPELGKEIPQSQPHSLVTEHSVTKSNLFKWITGEQFPLLDRISVCVEKRQKTPTALVGAGALLEWCAQLQLFSIGFQPYILRALRANWMMVSYYRLANHEPLNVRRFDGVCRAEKQRMYGFEYVCTVGAKKLRLFCSFGLQQTPKQNHHRIMSIYLGGIFCKQFFFYQLGTHYVLCVFNIITPYCTARTGLDHICDHLQQNDVDNVFIINIISVFPAARAGKCVQMQHIHTDARHVTINHAATASEWVHA